MAGYVALGVPLDYLLAASFMAAPGGLLMAKILEPEIGQPTEPAKGEQLASEKYINFIDAAATGAMNGLQMVGAIGAMLLAFIALIAMVNGMLEAGGAWLGIEQLTLERVLGGILQPLAWALGIPWDEAQLAGSLIGQKFILNEFVAYVTYSEVADQLSAHSQAIVIFALCGFANLSSIAILLGGLGAVAPSRRDDISRYGFRALIAASLSNLMSAALAGSSQERTVAKWNRVGRVRWNEPLPRSAILKSLYGPDDWPNATAVPCRFRLARVLAKVSLPTES